MGFLSHLKNQPRRGEIWIVNLDPTIGHEIKKSRPGLIIQNDIGNLHSPITIIAPITSKKIEFVHPFEAEVKGLSKPSKALLNQIRAIDKNRLVKRIGKADKDTVLAVNEAIRISLGLVEL